mgnify:CR=1 FL=1
MQKLFAHDRIVIFALGLLLGGALGYLLRPEPPAARIGTADTPAALTSVNIMIDDGHGSVRTWNTVEWHEAMSVMDLLELLATTRNITYEPAKDRARVVAIDDVRTSGTSTERWRYWVNNTYEPALPNKYYLKPGDIVLWKFVRDQGN